MFEYAKEELNKKIDEIESEISSKKEEEFSCKKDREHIISYLNIKSELFSAVRTTVFGSVLGAILIFIAWKSANTIPLFCGIACFPAMVVGIFKVNNKKKLLREDYSDVLGTSNQELSDELSMLNKKELNASLECKVLHKKRNYYCIELEKVKRYKNIIEEVVEEIAKDPYYKADTEQEYQMLVLAQDEKLKMMDDFLAETNDYASIHFDNSIGEQIQYTEDSKKLFKKI